MSRLHPQMIRRPRILATLATLGALGAFMTAATLAAPSVASAARAPQMTVYYNQLDLSTDPGTRALYRRIVNAAETVCPSENSLILSEVAASKTCQQEAIARAVARIGSARLAALQARSLARHG
jgi:UrcA family protein